MSRLITTLQEAYSAIIPYFLLTSVMALFLALLRSYDLSFLEISPQSISPLMDGLDLFSSIVITISVAYFFARQMEVSTIIAIMLSIASYATVMVHEQSEKLFLYGFSYGFVIQTLFIPLVSTYFLRKLYPWFNLRIPLKDQNLHVYRLFNYIFVFLAAYIVTVVLYQAIDYVLDMLIDEIEEYDGVMLPEFISLTLRDLLAQFFWFLGVDGNHTVNAIFGKGFLQKELFPNLTIDEFNRLFVMRGGAGAGLALLLALLWYARDGIVRIVTRISIPFVIFNINTLLIYAVVVFNRFLLVPFVGVPLLNIAVAYTALSWMPVAFNATEVAWMTPVFFDGYLKSSGSSEIMLLQLFLLLMDTVIYLYFVRKYMMAQSHVLQMQSLERSLELPYRIRAEQSVHTFQAHRRIISSTAKLDHILNTIEVDRMMVYFQPKICLQTGECRQFEALLRYREPSGKVAVPSFLYLVEEARMAPAIDMWVAKEVAAVIERWEHKEGLSATVSINLHPDTLTNSEALHGIAKLLQGKSIIFEIIERSFSGSEAGEHGMAYLQSEGFEIAIDDYGIGYSNLESIIEYDVSEIKIDKALIDRLDEPRGALVCEHIISLGHQLGIRIVAEGVEQIEQAVRLAQMKVAYIQGYLFSQAMPEEEVPAFVEAFNLSAYLPLSSRSAEESVYHSGYAVCHKRRKPVQTNRTTQSVPEVEEEVEEPSEEPLEKSKMAFPSFFKIFEYRFIK